MGGRKEGRGGKEERRQHYPAQLYNSTRVGLLATIDPILSGCKGQTCQYYIKLKYSVHVQIYWSNISKYS